MNCLTASFKSLDDVSCLGAESTGGSILNLLSPVGCNSKVSFGTATWVCSGHLTPASLNLVMISDTPFESACVNVLKNCCAKSGVCRLSGLYLSVTFFVMLKQLTPSLAGSIHFKVLSISSVLSVIVASR